MPDQKKTEYINDLDGSIGGVERQLVKVLAEARIATDFAYAAYKQSGEPVRLGFREKDYSLIAEILQRVKPIQNSTSTILSERTLQWQKTVEVFADNLEAYGGYTANGNKRFKRESFLKACLYGL
jgi:hypothetical protein